RRCRCLASNSTCWPNATIWQQFNKSVDGSLILVQPSAALCSGNPPDLNACTVAVIQWSNSKWRSDQVGAMQNHNWENSSCSAFLLNITCTQGAVPRLAVNATTVEHIQTTLQFVSKYNLRLVMKTTGHDYLGRSTAAGSLLLWLHYMKNMTLVRQYTSCTGERISNTIRVGAGVQWGEVYAWLSAYNLTAIGGASHTVASAGGYLQGGGHGPLTRWAGLAVDQVLEFDVITANGTRQTVNACQNKNLFWALRGGGPGTYAVVHSVVLRTYPSPTMIGAIYAVAAPNDTRYARFIQDFTRFIPTLADSGWAGYFSMVDLTIIISFFWPNGNLTVAREQFNKLMQKNMDLKFTVNTTFTLPSFYAFYTAVLASSNPTGFNVLLGSRLIPETIVRNEPDKVANVLSKIKRQSKSGSNILGHLVAGGKVSNKSINSSVNPAWRTALLHMVYVQSWPEGTSAADQQVGARTVQTQVALLDTIAGGAQSACYMNEADPNEPNWQQKYFGTQEIYNKLKSIKNAVDPSGLFICKNCVGSDDSTADLNCPLLM
ncbi:unnamed protein product, partial [Rotaria sp. Silwood2]